jgi:hypothetical protein
MQLILVLPALFDEGADTPAPARARALAQLMAQAGAPERQGGGIAGALAAQYGIARQGDWPLAPIRLAALGFEPGDSYWLAADPVTVEVGLTSAEIAGVVDDLGRGEADALLATLNAHFAGDELAFVAPRPDRLFVRAATGVRLTTVPTAAALRRPLRPLLPQGPDAAIWRRWQSEIEMLLHEHPVNVERERAGRAQVSSLWFSEGGTLPPRATATIAMFATDGTASALAAYAGTPARSLPADFRHAQAEAGSVDSIVIVPDRVFDVASVDHAWAGPARDALAAGSLDSFQLIGEDAGDAVIWRARRPGLWQRIAGRFQARDLRALLDAARQAA